MRDTSVLTSAVAYLFLLIYLATTGPPVLLLTWLFASPAILFTAALFGIRATLAMAGIRYRIIDGERMPLDRGAVYCINHTSYLDVVTFVALFESCRRLRVLYKAELQKIPIVAQAFALAGFIPLERADHEHAISALRLGTAALRQGYSMLTAPEGTRSADGRLLRFKKGAFVMAIEAQAPVVPVAVTGAARALPKGSVRIRPHEIIVRIGEPIETGGLGYDDRERVMVEARARIEALLAAAGDRRS